MNILHSMLIYNMIVVGGPGWKSAFGASAVVDEKPFKNEKGTKKIKQLFISKARALGRRVSNLVIKLKQ